MPGRQISAPAAWAASLLAGTGIGAALGRSGSAVPQSVVTPPAADAIDPRLAAGGAVAGGSLLTYLLARKMFGGKAKAAPAAEPQPAPVAPQPDTGAALLEALGHRRSGTTNNISVSPIFSLMAPPVAEPGAGKTAAEKLGIGAGILKGILGAGKAVAPAVGRAGKSFWHGTPFHRGVVNQGVAKQLTPAMRSSVDDMYGAAEKAGLPGFFDRAKGVLPFSRGGAGGKSQWLAQQYQRLQSGGMQGSQAQRWREFFAQPGYAGAMRQIAGRHVKLPGSAKAVPLHGAAAAARPSYSSMPWAAGGLGIGVPAAAMGYDAATAGDDVPESLLNADGGYTPRF
jgi:hypothetical protein